MGGLTGKEGQKEQANGELRTQKTTEMMRGKKGKKNLSAVKKIMQRRNAREGPNTLFKKEKKMRIDCCFN